MKCHDCPQPLTNATAIKRSISLKLVVLCRPCAHERGWIAEGFTRPEAVATREPEYYPSDLVSW